MYRSESYCHQRSRKQIPLRLRTATRYAHSIFRVSTAVSITFLLGVTSVPPSRGVQKSSPCPMNKLPFFSTLSRQFLISLFIYTLINSLLGTNNCLDDVCLFKNMFKL